MQTEQPILITSITAAGADLSRLRFVGFDGAVATAAAAALGVCNADTLLGNQAPVGVIGVFLVEAGGAISAGGDIEVGAGGKAVAFSAGKVVAQAFDAAAADGDVIRVLLR